MSGPHRLTACRSARQQEGTTRKTTMIQKVKTPGTGDWSGHSGTVLSIARPREPGLLAAMRVFILLLTAAAFMALPPRVMSGAISPESSESWQAPVTLGSDGWMLYENPRFGFALPVPPGMKALRPPDNGDGQAFATLDDKVRLAGWGSFNVDNLGDVDTRWKEELAEEDRTITYKKKTANWCVVSGVNKDGTGFYTRYTADKNHCAGWTITYPQPDEKKYQAWVERIAKGYEPRLGKGDDTIVEEEKK